MGAPFSGGEVRGPAFNDMAGGCRLSCHRDCPLIAAAGMNVTATAAIDQGRILCVRYQLKTSRSLQAYLPFRRSILCQAEGQPGMP